MGVPGYEGSGKSTLVRENVEADSVMVRMRGDDFLDPSRSHRRSSSWDGVDRRRLVSEVLAPFREEREGTFRRYDWSRRELGEPESVPAKKVPVVDSISLFRPEEALPTLDLKIWLHVPLEGARERGMRRDDDLGRDHSRLREEVCVLNEMDFGRNHSPRESAEIQHLA